MLRFVGLSPRLLLPSQCAYLSLHHGTLNAHGHCYHMSMPRPTGLYVVMGSHQLLVLLLHAFHLSPHTLAGWGLGLSSSQWVQPMLQVYLLCLHCATFGWYGHALHCIMHFTGLSPPNTECTLCSFVLHP